MTMVKSDGRLCFSIIPARYVFLLQTCLGVSLIYAYKGFLSVAIVAMVRRDNISDNTVGDECPAEVGRQPNSSEFKGDFKWDDHQQAIALGSYFYGYIITQIPAGIAAELFGAKWIFGSSMLASAILLMLGPIAAHSGFVPFLLTRLGQGLAHGVVLPCMNTMIARWMTKMERSRAVSIIMAGSAIGSVITLPLTGYLCEETFLGGWPAIFYVLGIAGCVWFIFWTVFVFDSPESHPFISQSEYDFILKGQGEEQTSTKRKIPWKSMLTSYRVYAMIIVHFGYNWGFLTVLTLLPTYFTNILHMNVKKNGLISSLPYIALTVVTYIASFTTDKLRERGFSITLLRKINNSIGFFGTGICLIGVVLSKCNTTLSIVFFVVGMGLNGCCYPGFLANYVDMAPDFAGVLMGLCNSLGNIPGFAAPYVAADFYSKGQTLQNWSHVFYTCFAVYVFTQIVYLLFTTSELQKWGLNRKEEQKEIKMI